MLNFIKITRGQGYDKKKGFIYKFWGGSLTKSV